MEGISLNTLWYKKLIVNTRKGYNAVLYAGVLSSIDVDQLLQAVGRVECAIQIICHELSAPHLIMKNINQQSTTMVRWIYKSGVLTMYLKLKLEALSTIQDI